MFVEMHLHRSWAQTVQTAHIPVALTQSEGQGFDPTPSVSSMKFRVSNIFIDYSPCPTKEFVVAIILIGGVVTDPFPAEVIITSF